MVKLKLFFFAFAIYVAEPAKILGIFPIPARSHFLLGFRLMKELADRGHEVTMVSPFPQKTPIANYTDVAVESLGETPTEYTDFYNSENMCFMDKIVFLHNMAYKLTEDLLSHNNLQTLLWSRAKFDLVITEYFLTDAILGMGNIFNAPVVLFSSLPPTSFNNIFANPAPSSYVPHLLTQYTGRMDFAQRFVNLAYHTFDAFFKHYYMFPLHDKLLKTYISQDLNLEDVMHSASLILLNSHPSIHEPVPHAPNMIEIGGFHVKPPNQLPSDLQAFMDEATDGVVIFSMESNLKRSHLNEEQREAILKSLGGIKQNVLWKYEEKNVPALPENVKLMKWLPEQDLLAHPNTKVFISHGGMLSTIETVYYGVPVIGIPVHGDQKMNIAKAENNGYAISLPLQELSEERLTWALNEVLNNPRYEDNVKTLSKIMKDRSLNPMATAVYWIEYAIRHNGCHHLQSARVHLSWFKRNMVDIIIILIVIVLISSLIIYYISKHIIRQVVIATVTATEFILFFVLYYSIKYMTYQVIKAFRDGRIL